MTGYLPRDLDYECLFFLDWNSYRLVCKHMKIDLRLNVYFKYNNPISIDNVYHKMYNQYGNYDEEDDDNLKIVKYLHSKDTPITACAIAYASVRGHLEVVKFLYSINAPIDNRAMNWASSRGHLNVVKYLHLVGAPYDEDATNWACHRGHLEVVKFLHSIGTQFEALAMKFARDNDHIDIVDFLRSINAPEWNYYK